MVCEANAGVVHDFLTDPIELVLEGDLLRANGTTLGADNGVAVAIMLALLESDVPHPALECLFTTDEEVGLGGMRQFDPTVLRSRRMINLDSAGEGEATVSCAGGVRSRIHFPYDDAAPCGDTHLCVYIKGLAGGHSGEDIHLGRIGALSAMGRILFAASAHTEISLTAVEGGNRDNAIPRECTAWLAVSDEKAFRRAVKQETDAIRAELVGEDGAFEVIIAPVALSSFRSPRRSMELIALLRTLPNGVHGMSRSVPGLVETSSNLAVIRSCEGGCEIVVSSRSSVESRLDDMENRVAAAAMLAGAEAEHTSRYPGWDHTLGSPMQALYLASYKALSGTDARIIGIHAGLECGLLKGRIPDMDIVSIGPDIRNLHSPDEVLSVSSLSRLWDLVCEMLKNG